MKKIKINLHMSKNCSNFVADFVYNIYTYIHTYI